MPYAMNEVHQCDALELLASLPDSSVDAVITDLPYGTTACSWDEIIPFAPMWAGVKRILKPRGAFVTTASQPFTIKLVMSNLEWFKYCWVWVKTMATGFVHAKNKPMKRHEDIVVFSPGTTVHANQSGNRMNYFPQMAKGERWKKKAVSFGMKVLHAPSKANKDYLGSVYGSPTGDRYPNSIIECSNGNYGVEHPTQKPVELYEYLIKTYTLPNQLVLDFCCGSGTTLVAARNLGRRFIGCDLQPEYVEIARKRLAEPFTPSLFTEDTTATNEQNPAQMQFDM